MSAQLQLELETAAFEAARGDAAFVCFFEDERPLRGSAGRADWRLCGWLSTLIAQGRLTGARGEAVLVPTGGGLRAPILIGLGVGRRSDFDERVWAQAVREVARRSLLLSARSVALALPPASQTLGLRQRVEGLVRGAAAALAEKPGELRLRLVAEPEEAPRVFELLRGMRLRALPDSVSVHVATEGARLSRSRAVPPSPYPGP